MKSDREMDHTMVRLSLCACDTQIVTGWKYVDNIPIATNHLI